MNQNIRHSSKSRILLELVASYQKSTEDVRLMELSKQKSVQQIERRFEKSETNKNYEFMRNNCSITELDPDDEIPLIYNLNEQNHKKNDITSQLYQKLLMKKQEKAKPVAKPSEPIRGQMDHNHFKTYFLNMQTKHNEVLKQQDSSRNMSQKQVTSQILKAKQILQNSQHILNSHRSNESRQNSNDKPSNFKDLLQKIYVNKKYEKTTPQQSQIKNNKSMDNKFIPLKLYLSMSQKHFNSINQNPQVNQSILIPQSRGTSPIQKIFQNAQTSRSNSNQNGLAKQKENVNINKSHQTLRKQQTNTHHQIFNNCRSFEHRDRIHKTNYSPQSYSIIEQRLPKTLLHLLSSRKN